MTRDEVLQEFELDQFWVDGANIHRMADEIVRLREQLAEKTNSYRSSVIAAEAETKQWKEFFYAERHRAERDAAVRERDAFFDDWKCAVGLLDEARDVAHENAERADRAEAELHTIRARLAACERVVEAAVKAREALLISADLLEIAVSSDDGLDASEAVVGINAARDAVLLLESQGIADPHAAVAAETCARSAPITVGDTQGEK
jgi:hypothetical protein